MADRKGRAGRKMMTALELYQRQCKYDRLHHLRMIRILTGTTDPQDKRALDLHRRAIERPAEGYNVVDLDNLEYVKILDSEGQAGKVEAT